MWAPSFISSIDLRQRVTSMAFPHSLSISEMAKYVAYYFEWDRRRVAFPPLPLPNHFQALCLSYDLVVAEEAAQRFELSELPQVIFYAILLNEAERLGVLHGRTLRIMESALTELRWNTFEAWVWQNGDRIFKARFWEKAGHEEESSDAEEATSPSGDDKQGEAERAVLDFELPEVIQATFYAMLLNDAVELGIVSGFLAVDLKLTLEGLRKTLAQRPNPLLADYHGLYPGFDLSLATQHAQDSNIPEMVQAIFYAMVVNDAVELGLTCRLTAECMMWVMQKLDWVPIEFWLENIDCRLGRA
ncbi:hypothetical protein Cgig2_017650 [Carnegiea gigantea]|uniref:Uncharacterized protein n=1 Tax=Carnegiea gigantea TaxID=171969 RepID=A0A9Q1KCP2_9CARY|nr:hypothetical protein Cgig2_017650 [Carnegiea gigantea]